MKKKQLIAVMACSLFMSCTVKDQLPKNPKDKEKHEDSRGNVWIYSSAMNRWGVISPRNNSAASYYYPSNGMWTNGTGKTVNAPSNVNASTYRPSSKPNASGKSYSGSKPSSSGKSFGSSVGSKSSGG